MNGPYKRLRGSLSIRSSLGDRGQEILEGEGVGEGRKVNGTPKGNRSTIRPVSCERNPRRRRNQTPVGNVFEQHRDPCSGSPTDATNYQKYVSNFTSTWLANRQWLFLTDQSWRALKSWYTGGGPRTWILALFRRRTKPEVKFRLWHRLCKRSLKAWFPYDRPDRPSPAKKFRDDPDDWDDW